MSLPFDFGVPGLESLIPHSSADSGGRPWSAAIVGPDGCGKSILALSLASTYWSANCAKNDRPRVVYVSTDLSFEQADRQWRSFGLDRPVERADAIRIAYDDLHRERDTDNTPLDLKQILPIGEQNALRELLGGQFPAVCFLDLQSQTAGDDWGYINHLIGLLPEPSHKGPKHLLIIDAVEGLEAFVGDVDAYGQTRKRRSRIAQLIRNAYRAFVHVVFVVEPLRDARLPEQFVTDLVIRLHHRQDGDYSQRTIEIEKCRSLEHARGQHEFMIRKGNGATTGNYFHKDEPKIDWPYSKTRNEPGYLGHVRVVRSIHRWNRELRATAEKLPSIVGRPTFGLDQLDDLCGNSDISSLNDRKRGGSITLLLGDAGTHKSRLARRFLSRAFSIDGYPLELANESGAAVLVTTDLIDQTFLANRIALHLLNNSHEQRDNWQDEVGSIIENRTFCRRLGVQHLTSASFLELLEVYIRRAQEAVYALDKGEEPRSQSIVDRVRTLRITERRRFSHRIRLVIDNWQQILSTHPNLGHDPLFMQSVLTLLKREGITALIVATQPGQPTLPATALSPHDLRKLEEFQIFTWGVPFFGEQRVAITTLRGATSSAAPVIYELRPQKFLDQQKDDNEVVEIGRHFALYAGLDRGIPKRIPLLVRLFQGPQKTDPTQETEPAFVRMLQDTFTQLFPSTASSEQVLKFEPVGQYDGLFVFAHALDDSRLDHTLVFQIDEFWSEGKRSLLDLSPYLNARVSSRLDASDHSGRQEDIYGMFQPHDDRNLQMSADVSPGSANSRGDFIPAITARKPEDKLWYLRRDMFIELAQSNAKEPLLNRTPYIWDFGFLIADRDVWDRNQNLIIDVDKHAEMSLLDIWDALALEGSRLSSSRLSKGKNRRRSERRATRPVISWDVFFAACRAIAKQENIASFDVDLTTSETANCLVLEIWASIDRRLRKGSWSVAFDGGQESRRPMRWLLDEFRESLFVSLVLLLATCPHLRAKRRTIHREHTSSKAAASREWYSTASSIMRNSASENISLLRQPGSFTTRGDWSLAVAAGSRSEILAHRALDLISSRRMALLRLQDGVGLPARDILPDEKIGLLNTALRGFNRESQRFEEIKYCDICELGANNQEKFFWLFRSSIQNYDRDNFYWRRWIARMIEEQNEWLPVELRTEDRLKQLTNELHDGVVRRDPFAKSFQQFLIRLDVLLAALRD